MCYGSGHLHCRELGLGRPKIFFQVEFQRTVERKLKSRLWTGTSCRGELCLLLLLRMSGGTQNPEIVVRGTRQILAAVGLGEKNSAKNVMKGCVVNVRNKRDFRGLCLHVCTEHNK